ncbi:MAG: hypothetical protein M1829_004450 [Trizodia sp. TS-e1964]|nr:MAG: hypothetical protein M1829_004450 [Trizodia sp. TS-e1964]
MKRISALPSEETIAERSIAGTFGDGNLGHKRCLARSSSSSQSPISALEYKTGIIWKFAYQGSALLGLSIEESESVSRGPNDGNAEFGRQLYLDAISYLLRALPADLKPEEQLSLHSSIPPSVTRPLRLEITKDQFLEIQAAGTNEIVPSKQSILHRYLASAIVSLFLFVHFALPYLQLFIRKAYNYDRTHHITEKLLARGINTAQDLGKTGLKLWNSIYDPSHGKYRQLLSGAAAWCIEGIIKGIYDGVGEGMVIIGVKG